MIYLADEAWRSIQHRCPLEPDRGTLQLYRAVTVRDRPYLIWRYQSQAEPDLKIGPENHYAVTAFPPYLRYVSCYSNHDMMDIQLGADALTAEQFAVLDYNRFQERERLLEHYRKRVEETLDDLDRHRELALMIWHCFNSGGHLPGSLEEAVAVLSHCLERKPTDIKVLGLLGLITYTLGGIDMASMIFQRACEVDKKSPVYPYYVHLIALEAGNSQAANKALREAKERAKSQKRGKPPWSLYSNPAEDYRDKLSGQVEQLRKKVEGFQPLTDKMMAEQDQAEIRIDKKNVPEPLHVLIPLVKKWGVGDDTSRGYIVRHATKKEKAELRRAYAQHAEAIQEWLDSFEPETMPSEAACFMYMCEAHEELDAE